VIGKVDAEEGQGCKRQSGLCVDQRKDRERQKQVRGLYASSKGDRKSEVGQRKRDRKERGNGRGRERYGL